MLSVLSHHLSLSWSSLWDTLSATRTQRYIKDNVNKISLKTLKFLFLMVLAYEQNSSICRTCVLKLGYLYISDAYILKSLLWLDQQCSQLIKRNWLAYARTNCFLKRYLGIQDIRSTKSRTWGTWLFWSYIILLANGNTNVVHVYLRSKAKDA